MIKFQKLITPLLAFMFISPAFAQSEKDRVANYINNYKNLAMAEMMRSGIPASITLAQGILETAGGQSDLAFMANNHFGIKCKGEWTGETMSHDDDAKNECFRKYPSVEASFQDHSNFLRTRPNYSFLFKLDPTDYEGWAKGLKKAGYATNPAYAQKLMKIIVENNLQQYSLMALNPKGDQEGNLVEETLSEEVVASQLESRITPNFLENLSAGEAKFSAKKEGYPEGIFTINDTKVIYVEAGTSLLAVANNYKVSYKKIMEFNDLDGADILANSQLIYLSKKQKRGSKEIHIVQKDENLHDIAQKEGIQLSSILEFNRMNKGMEPATGEKLYLKAMAPFSPKLASVNSKAGHSNM